jgi:hypothetical protein
MASGARRDGGSTTLPEGQRTGVQEATVSTIVVPANAGTHFRDDV